MLRRFREARDLSQQALALEADVDRTYVGAVERGEQNVSFENLWQLVAALQITWADLGAALDAEPPLRERPRTRRDVPSGSTWRALPPVARGIEGDDKDDGERQTANARRPVTRRRS